MAASAGTSDGRGAWSPDSWRGRPIHQQPEYKDAEKLRAALDKVRALPPIVHALEVDSLRVQLAEAQEGKRFLLQGGDCAETFAGCTREVRACVCSPARVCVRSGRC